MEYFLSVFGQALHDSWDLVFGAPLRRVGVGIILAAIGLVVYLGVREKGDTMKEYLQPIVVAGGAAVVFLFISIVINFVYVAPKRLVEKHKSDLQREKELEKTREQQHDLQTAQIQRELNAKIEGLKAELSAEKEARKQQIQGENSALNAKIETFKKLYSMQSWGKGLLRDCIVLSSDSNSEIPNGGLRQRSRIQARAALQDFINKVESELATFNRPYYPGMLQKFEPGPKMSEDEALYARAKDRLERLPEYIGYLSAP